MAYQHNDLVVTCDFCDTTIEKTIHDLGGNQWTWAQRGAVYPTGQLCILERQMKHSCPDPLCQAKLLVWARS